MRIHTWQIVVVLLVIVILFGAKRLPDVASSVGKSLKIFKKEVAELREDDTDTTSSSTTTAPRPSADTSADVPGTGSASPENPPVGGYPGADTPSGTAGRS